MALDTNFVPSGWSLKFCSTKWCSICIGVFFLDHLMAFIVVHGSVVKLLQGSYCHTFVAFVAHVLSVLNTLIVWLHLGRWWISTPTIFSSVFQAVSLGTDRGSKMPGLELSLLSILLLKLHEASHLLLITFFFLLITLGKMAKDSGKHVRCRVLDADFCIIG